MPEIRPTLIEVLEKCDNALCARLFGSQATGRATKALTSMSESCREYESVVQTLAHWPKVS
jgi:hypothetical protein